MQFDKAIAKGQTIIDIHVRLKKRMSELQQRLLSTSCLVCLALVFGMAHASPEADSWQQQTLLATTEDEYLVLEKSGYTPGFPPEYVEVLRYVTYNAINNEEISQILISATKSRFADGGATAKTRNSESDITLSALLEKFGGTVPRPPRNLAKRFVSDASGLYVMDGSEKILVFRASELSKRKSGAGNTHTFKLPKAINLMVGSGKYYLTLRSLDGGGAHEVIMAITR